MLEQSPQRVGTSRSKTPQFSIRFLFVLIVVVAIAMFPIAYEGPEAALLSFWIFAIAAAVFFFIKGIPLTGCAVLMVAIVASCFIPEIPGPSGQRPQTECENNFRHLGLAMHGYQVQHGHFPPPYITDANGVPMHSWRVLILPHMEELTLYNQYDFSKPWDHPDNLRLEDQMPAVFRCPSDTSGSRHETIYVAIVGDETMWPPAGNRTLADVSDGEDKTLLLVESSEHRTHWMAPNDIKFSDVAARPPGDDSGLGDEHHSGANFLFTNGAMHFIAPILSLCELKALATIDGGEDVDPGLLP